MSASLQSYLDEDPRARPLSEWLWGLSHWGQPVLVRAALAFAGPCPEAWRRELPRRWGRC